MVCKKVIVVHKMCRESFFIQAVGACNVPSGVVMEAGTIVVFKRLLDRQGIVQSSAPF